MTTQVLFNRYRILKQLNSKHFAVFKVRDRALNRIIVLKTLNSAVEIAVRVARTPSPSTTLLRAPLRGETEKVSDTPTEIATPLRERKRSEADAPIENIEARHNWLLRREAQIAAGLEHPNVVRIYHLDCYQDLPYYTMAYADRGSLLTLMQQETQTPQQFLRLMTQIAEALEFIHSRHWIHLDLKPTNILLSSLEGIKLADFGLAESIANGRTPQFIESMGTPPYRSPEQVNGDSLTVQSDLYALGVICYEWLVGSRLPDFSQKREKRQAISQFEGCKIDRKWIDLVIDCLSDEKAKRPASAREFIARLNR